MLQGRNMKMKKPPGRRFLIVSAIVVYLVFPFFAGVFSYYDRRGPLIYPEAYHDLCHRVGWALAGHRGKPRVPFHLERTIFYQWDGFREETFD
jgi:hypothetical protein